MSRALPVRMWRAALLDPRVYEEVEAEASSLPQALVVVVLASAASALGAWLADRAALRVAVDLLEPFVLWLGGSAFAYMVGATFFRGPHTETDYREVLRTVGFAFAPALLRLLAFAPSVAPVGLGFANALLIATDLWVLAAGIVAVRQALDFTTLRAIGTFLFAYLLMWLSFEGLLLNLPTWLGWLGL